MDPFQVKRLNEAFNIANELQRRDYMFEHGLTNASSLADMDVHNARLEYRGERAAKERFRAIFKRNVYACYLGLDIRRDFYQNVHSYKKPLYKIRKGEKLARKLFNAESGAKFQ